MAFVKGKGAFIGLPPPTNAIYPHSNPMKFVNSVSRQVPRDNADDREEERRNMIVGSYQPLLASSYLSDNVIEQNLVARQDPAFAFSELTDSYQKITKHRSIFRHKKGKQSDSRLTILHTGGGTASDRIQICALYAIRRTIDEQNPFSWVWFSFSPWTCGAWGCQGTQ